MQAIDHNLADTFKLPVDEGVLVVNVVDGSPADRAGLKGGDRQVIVDGTSYVLGGDIVTQADGQQVEGPDDLRRLIMEKNPGDSITLGHPPRRLATNYQCHARAPARPARRLARPRPLPPGA